ncbi:MAG: hypothetical protein M3Q03_08005 [Chloroflexota bacterium]|nr:hypothetical protein [Chloroflexota bacterium]
MAEKTGDAASEHMLGPPDPVVVGGARTPEELETLFEDALLIRDPASLATLFEEAAVLVTGDAQPARGGEEIARLALATWEGDRTYVAEPRRVVQARDIALIVVERGVNVARRDRNGTWRYAVLLKSVDD